MRKPGVKGHKPKAGHLIEKQENQRRTIEQIADWINGHALVRRTELLESAAIKSAAAIKEHETLICMLTLSLYGTWVERWKFRRAMRKQIVTVLRDRAEVRQAVEALKGGADPLVIAGLKQEEQKDG